MPHPQPNPQVLLETNPKHYPKKQTFLSKKDFARMLLLSFRR